MHVCINAWWKSRTLLHDGEEVVLVVVILFSEGGAGHVLGEMRFDDCSKWNPSGLILLKLGMHPISSLIVKPDGFKLYKFHGMAKIKKVTGKTIKYIMMNPMKFWSVFSNSVWRCQSRLQSQTASPNPHHQPTNHHILRVSSFPLA
jgi:hypothetical protein